MHSMESNIDDDEFTRMMPPVRFAFLSFPCRRPRKTFDSHLIFSLSLSSPVVINKNSRKDSKVCQWETPKELKGGLQKNLRICPLEATLLPQNTMPESGWVELTTTTTTTNAAISIDKHDVNDDKEGKKESRTEEEKTQTANAKSSSKKKYYWHPASKQVTWQRPRRVEQEVQEAEILPLQFSESGGQ